MREELNALLERAYAPYSKFKVAAITVMNDGTMYNGVNVENASYGATICAERTSILTAVTAGYRKGDFKEIYIMTTGKKISTCCFMCRQVIKEFFYDDAKVICMNQDGDFKEYKVGELCPYPFSEDDL